MLPNRFIIAAANSLPERAPGKPKTCAPVHRLVRPFSISFFRNDPLSDVSTSNL